ncbi:MAG: hypothetical protein AB7D92_11955 [Sphaerochaeta sp.]
MKHVSTERLSLKTLSSSDGEMLQAFLLQNRTFFSPWDPLRDDAYYSKEAILQRIEEELLLARGGKQLSLYLTKQGEARIIGSVTLSEVHSSRVFLATSWMKKRPARDTWLKRLHE